MPRCSICDFTPDIPSDYHNALTHMSGPKKVIYDRGTSNYYCTECYDEIRENYHDLISVEKASKEDDG